MEKKNVILNTDLPIKCDIRIVTWSKSESPTRVSFTYVQLEVRNTDTNEATLDLNNTSWHFQGHRLLRNTFRGTARMTWLGKYHNDAYQLLFFYFPKLNLRMIWELFPSNTNLTVTEFQNASLISRTVVIILNKFADHFWIENSTYSVPDFYAIYPNREQLILTYYICLVKTQFVTYSVLINCFFVVQFKKIINQVNVCLK